MKLNIIADIAGRFDELMLLLKKMPEADLTVCLGDLPDRGTQSKQVIEYLMNAPKTKVIKGNHDQLMVNACRDRYDTDIWTYNGGWKTIESYGGAIELVPKEHIDWLDGRPLYLDFDDLFLSHAPVPTLQNLPNKYSRDPKHIATVEGNFIWNRYAPKKPLDGKKFHIHGHNSTYKEYKWGNGYIYGICLDNSSKGELKGIHWNGEKDYQIFTEGYIK